ncbi:MAG: excisionase family DNA-binding protein [Gemmatimonadota bacterium]|jgi:excisionase family DNA binding protein
MERFDDQQVLSTSQVAELLSVHPSTVKRWCEAGTIEAEKTAGGHRRFRLHDVLAGARERGVSTILDAFGPYEAHVWSALEAIRAERSFGRVHALAMGWISRGHHERVGRLFEMLGHHPDVPLPLLLDEGVGGFMARVGQSWRDGRLRVGEEHLASQTLLESLLRLRTSFLREGSEPRSGSGPSEKLAVVGSTDGDLHHLGALCVRLVLEREGWETLYLGPSVPVEDFASVQRARQASLVCISISPTDGGSDPIRSLRTLEGLYDPTRPYALALGGRGVRNGNGSLARLEATFRGVALFDSCEAFVDSLRSGFGRSPRPAGDRDARSAARRPLATVGEDA